MGTERPNKDEIFNTAAELGDAEERAAFLDQVCADNSKLKAEIIQLLEMDGGDDSLLDVSAPGLMRTEIRPLTESSGDAIGPYKLLQQIGEGGMGVVYMAEQTHPVARRVALKIIKPGMDTRQVTARFEAERQSLAMMDHPNIAKVLDAGTTSSDRPYFVMELVKGIPVTQYCDEQHLTPRERLELFIPICHAVQHAHQKGIIHRDLKPSNILIAQYDDRPVPKIIDFGVAKAVGHNLTEKTMFTQYGQIVGTIEYMSPEQARFNQLDVDTRSDVYSLGVLLYELLTGETPFDKQRLRAAAFDELLRIIREEEPPRPSTKLSSSKTLANTAINRKTEPKKLSLLVRGEIDWIVMKALEKDRNRRYETATGFAADVLRYLTDEPVQACPPSAGYKFRKFARRNKGRLVTTSLLAIALLTTVGGVGWALRDRAAQRAEIVRERETREAEIAREQEQRLIRTRTQLELILTDVDRLMQQQDWDEALSTVRRAEAVVTSGEADAATVQRVHDLLQDLEFIDRLEQIRMQWATLVEGKFDYAGADREYARAFRDYGVDVDESAVVTSIDCLKARPALSMPLATALDDWVFVRRKLSERDAAEWKRLVDVARGIDPEPLRDRLRSTWGQPVTELQDELHRMAESIQIRSHHPATLVSLAQDLARVDRSDSAIRLLRDAQSVYPEDFWLNYDLAAQLYEQKDFEGAVRFFTAAVSIRPHAVAARNFLGNALRGQGKLDEAIAAYRKAIELDAKYAMAYSNLGVALSDQGKLDEAIAAYRKAIEVDPKFAGAHYNFGALLCDDLREYDNGIECFRKAIELDPKYAPAHNKLGIALRAQKKVDEAIAAYRKAIELDPKFALAHYNFGTLLCDDLREYDNAIECFRKAIELDPKYANGHFSLGNALRGQKRLDEAIAAYRRAIEIDPNLAIAHNNLGAVLSGQGKLDEAIACYRTAIELDAKNAMAYSNLGVALSDQGKLEEAIAAFRTAIEVDPKFAGAHNNLGGTLYDLKKFDEAAACFRKAIEVDPKDAIAHSYLGNTLSVQKKLDEAIACYRKAIELDPRYENAITGIGNALGKKGWDLVNNPDPKFRDFNRAVEASKEAVEFTPQSSYAWQCLGWVHYRAGNWSASIEALEKSCTLQKGGTGDCFQWIVMSLAHGQLVNEEDLPEQDRARHQAESRHLYSKAVKQIDGWRPGGNDLMQAARVFRAEAEELLEVKKQEE